MKIDLFITCLNDALFPQTGLATARLLRRLGHTVRFNEAQTCCGQMHFNTGYQKEALPLIRKFVNDFRDSEVIVAPSGSCVAFVRDLYPKAAEWAGDAELLQEVTELGKRTYELSEFLVRVLGVDDVGAYYPHRVTYHPTCHAARLLQGGRRAAETAAKRARPDLAGTARQRSVLRLRRHLQRQESGNEYSDAGRQGAERSGHRGRAVYGGRQLLPDAHRRRPEPVAKRRGRGPSGGDSGAARESWVLEAHETVGAMRVSAEALL